jgi:hypothetical protein
MALKLESSLLLYCCPLLDGNVYLRGTLRKSLDEFRCFGPIPVVPHAVDEKCRGAVHPAADSATKIVAHFPRVRSRRQLARQSLRVDTDSHRVEEEIFLLQRLLVAEEHVVHLPEPALRSRTLRRLGRRFGVGMRLGQREVAVNEPELIAHIAPDSLHYRIGASAVGAFEIAVFDERHRSIARAQRVIAFVYRNCKLRYLHESVSVSRKPNARHTCFYSPRSFMVASADYTALSGNPHKIFAFV